jgi:uncharacterized membrane protein
VASSASGATAPALAGTGMSSNVAGLLTYIFGFITGVIFLTIEPYKNDKFVRFHAFQSIFFNVALVVFWIAFAIVTTILGFVSRGFLGVAPLRMFTGVWLLFSLAVFAYWIFLMYEAYNNEVYRIPFIGELAAKQMG